MVIYWILILFTFFFHLFFQYRYFGSRLKITYFANVDDNAEKITSREIVERKTITVFFIIYIILLCLRKSSVGIDSAKYISAYFESFKNMDLSSIIKNTNDELGFSLLSKLISVLTNSSQVYLAIISLISVIPIMILYRKESKDAVLCCSFFLISLLFEAFFSALREGIALGLIVPAYYFVKKKKIIPFILIVLFATSFHLSAFIMILLFPIYHAKITWKWLWWIVPLMIILYRFSPIIFNAVLVRIGGKYASKYLTYGYNSSGQYGLLILFVLISIYCFVLLDENKANREDIGLRNILLLATALQLFAPLHVLASRMNYYFIIFIPIALTNTNNKCKTAYWQISVLARFVMIAYFVFYFFFMKGDSLRIMDYHFCFSQS